ncbi:TniB family NTP-binding protein [Idiomarina sp. HP20-50]|uniref:TniB family NTP-binding protein n=1 Tax=Idiomarina sp. HP20-50 TaxID=3070813 RepID=UPI00294B19E8|nr:TniB family NTP-binding protein [Idiomarina sp. HP20-50]MDV6316275.1 TniB family NTP-binding protein [Idiomarina sp. HP20-50]
MNSYPHLHKNCIEKLEWDAEARVKDIAQPRWIGYPRAHEVLQRFDDILVHPRVSRMPNLMLIGRTNNGKTELLRKFCQQHLPDPNSSGDSFIAPVMYMQAPPSPNESDLYVQILNSLYERVPASSISAKRSRVIDVLRTIELKVLCIDELHNSLAGSSVKQQNFLNTLKYLGNELKISFIASGTEDLLRATSIDTQIQNRFEPILLKKWTLTKEFRQLLRTFESILPLKRPSKLYSGLLSKKILALSEGTIGELSSLLNKATVYAIRSGSECIDIEVLSNCGYISPSDRIRDSALGI